MKIINLTDRDYDRSAAQGIVYSGRIFIPNMHIYIYIFIYIDFYLRKKIYTKSAGVFFFFLCVMSLFPFAQRRTRENVLINYNVTKKRVSRTSKEKNIKLIKQSNSMVTSSRRYTSKSEQSYAQGSSALFFLDGPRDTV